MNGDGIHRRAGAYLPHWTREGATYSVTFRLADSLPTEALAELERLRAEFALTCRQLRTNQVSPDRGLSMVRQIQLWRVYQEQTDALLNAGAGECWMNRPDIADLVEGALRFFDN